MHPGAFLLLVSLSAISDSATAPQPANDRLRPFVQGGVVAGRGGAGPIVGGGATIAPLDSHREIEVIADVDYARRLGQNLLLVCGNGVYNFSVRSGKLKLYGGGGACFEASSGGSTGVPSVVVGTKFNVRSLPSILEGRLLLEHHSATGCTSSAISAAFAVMMRIEFTFRR